MIYLLSGLCAVLVLIICILIMKIIAMHRAADDICRQFSKRINEDTNVGIDTGSSDRHMKRLAAELDRQLKCLRQEYIRYSRGDRELKEAVTNISHDLRTPLTAICGYMELISREPVSEPVREYLDIVANRVEALKQLTEELFRYSVIVSVNPYDSREMVALGEVLEESIVGYYGALKDAGIEPEIFIPEEKIVRPLNRAALSRIFANVLSNAVKYSSGDLIITLGADGNIEFSNHAPLLDEVTVGRLFDRFYTVENGKNSTGLGLSIAKILTEQMDGDIYAGLEDELFTIRLSF